MSLQECTEIRIRNFKTFLKIMYTNNIVQLWEQIDIESNCPCELCFFCRSSLWKRLNGAVIKLLSFQSVIFRNKEKCKKDTLRDNKNISGLHLKYTKTYYDNYDEGTGLNISNVFIMNTTFNRRQQWPTGCVQNSLDWGEMRNIFLCNAPLSLPHWRAICFPA